MPKVSIGVKVMPEMAEQLRILADSSGMAFADFLRSVLAERLSNDNDRKPPDNHSEQSLTLFTDQIKQKDEQISQANDQIRELHTLMGMSQKNTNEMTLQLNRANRQVEDMRKRRWWRIWGRR